MIPVVWLDDRRLCWDQTLLDDALSGRLWPTGYTFTHHVGFADAPPSDFAVVIVPGRCQAGNVAAINRQLSRYAAVLVCVTSDEERLFPVEQLQHPNMRLWLQTPGPTDKADLFLPIGYSPHIGEQLDALVELDRNGWTFAGQVNHERRRQCVAALRQVDGGTVCESPGFSLGLDRATYAHALACSRVVPCPSGPHTVDSFRAWETLEAGSVPVVDTFTPKGDAGWYWPNVTCGEIGFPSVGEWTEFGEVYRVLNDAFPAYANQLQSQWQNYKRRFCERISDTVRQMSGVMPDVEPVTVLMPTSPVASHPDTAIIEQTVSSVRHHLPDAEILIMCDGVRAEQAHYRERYDRYLNRLTWLCARKWKRVLPIVHRDHLHQSEMTRRALPMVRSPLVLFVEHDTPLVTDEPTDFAALIAACRADRADMIRLHFESHVLPDHAHLMLDETPQMVEGAPMLRTVQWSQRPHLAPTAFYRRVIAEHFPEGHTGMIEDVMHGIVHNAWRDFGLAGWDRYRLWTYAPPGGNIKRSYTLDGRGNDPKWVDS